MKTKFILPHGMQIEFSNLLGQKRLDVVDINGFIDDIAAKTEKAINEIRINGVAKEHYSKDGNLEHVYFLRMPYVKDGYPNTPQSILKLINYREKFKQTDAVIFLGIGGSYLGAQVLVDTIGGFGWNYNTPLRKGFPRIYFSGNNLDAEDCQELIAELLRHAEKKNERTKEKFNVLLIPISKSGTTLETILSFMHFYEILKNADDISLKCAVVTDLNAKLENAPLLQLAEKFNWDRFDIKEGIGGRFSVMTDPGLLALTAVGGNIEEFLQGAKDMDEYCQKADIKENPAFINAVLKYLAYCKGVDIEVFMPYCMRLKALSEWYVQLLAESLGKRFDRNGQEVNYGRTPVVAVGTTDMHAQTQQHQEGKRNKIIQFAEVNQIENDITIKNPFNDVEVLSKYTGLKMHDALKIALDANEKALNSDNRYNAKFVIPQINEYYLGQFMYFLMLSIAYEGEIANVDAYNQPGVEIYKKFMKEEL